MNVAMLKLAIDKLDDDMEVDLITNDSGVDELKDSVVFTRSSLHNNFKYIPLEGSKYILLLSSEPLHFILRKPTD